MKHSETLSDVARRLDHLTQHHRDPERFYLERDQLVHDVRRVSNALRAEGDPAPKNAGLRR